MKTPKIYLSSNIKFLRTYYRKTQSDLAKICHKKNTAVSNWESGTREPNSIDLARLANYFNISIDDFMLKDLREEFAKNSNN